MQRLEPGLLLKEWLESVSASPLLSDKSKADALKVIRCLIYINDNLSFIQWAVDNRNDPSVYKYPKDKRRGLLRDRDGTSFHIKDYQNGNEAVVALTNLLQQYATALADLPKPRWSEFADKLVYDKKIGCLEARTGPSLHWVTNQRSTPIRHLNDIMSVCTQRQRTTPEKNLITLVLAYCQEQGMTRCVYSDQEVVITPELIRRYMVEVLGEDENDALNEQSAIDQYAVLCQPKCRTITGRQSMIQHHFTKRDSAEALVAWLKQQASLQGLQIQKARVTDELHEGQKVFVVRLTQAQHAKLIHQNDAAKTVHAEPLNARRNDAIVLKMVDNIPGLYRVLEKVFNKQMSEDDFIGFIAKTSASAINTILLVKFGVSNITALTAAVQILPEKAFFAFIEKISAEQLNKGVIIETKELYTPLHTLARYQSEKAFLATIERISAEQFNKGVIMEGSDQWTPLHMIARFQSEKAFLATIEKILPEKLNQVAIMPNNRGWTPLHMIASFQSEKNFLAIIEKILPQKLNEAVMMETNEQWTLLHAVAGYPSEKALLALINMSSAASINKACLVICKSNNGKCSILKLLLTYQSASAIIALLDKLDDDTLTFLLKHDQTDTEKLFRVLHQSNYEKSDRLIARLIKCSPLLQENCLKLWSEAKALPINALHTLQDVFSQHRKATLTRLQQDYLAWHAAGGDTVAEHGGHEVAAASDHAQFLSQLLKHGVRSFSHYRHLRQIQDSVPQLQLVVDTLARTNLLFVGSPLNLEDFLKLHPEQTAAQRLLDIKSCILSHQALIKIINPGRWEVMLKQLLDYNYRAPLRRPLTAAQKREITHKFVHLTGEIIPHKRVYKRAPAAGYTHTKKSSATLLASSMSSTLFGDHDATRPLVGLLFHSEKCVIKAMLKYDTGTWKRKWVGTYDEMISYREQLLANEINFTDPAKFIDYVASHPECLNEVLTELSRESLLAIVIAKDTPVARKIARQRYRDVQERLHLSLPVIFYDRQLSKLHFYTELEMQEDELAERSGKSCNLLLEKAAKNALMTISAKIKAKPYWHSWFWKEVSTTPPPAAAAILTKIDAALAAEQAGRLCWAATLDSVKPLLERGSWYEVMAPDTEDFYRQLRQQL